MKFAKWMVPSSLILIAAGWLAVHPSGGKPANAQRTAESMDSPSPVDRSAPAMRAGSAENERSVVATRAPIATNDEPKRAASDPVANARSAAPPGVAIEDLRDYMRVAVHDQQPDARWTKEVKGLLQDAVRDLAGEGTALRSVACGADTCEARIVHDSEDAYIDFMRKAFKGHGFKWTGEAFVTRNEQSAEAGKQEMIVFLARPQGRLPRLD